jgi:hypothetical protein
MMRLSMMALLRSTLRDAQFHGFDSAQFSYAAVLSLMEDGILHWHDTARIAEERRSALVSRGVSSNSSSQQFAVMSGAHCGGGGGSSFGMNVNSHARAGSSRSVPNN